MTVASAPGEWHFTSYAALMARASGAASALASLCGERRGVVLLVGATSVELVSAFLGALHAGFIPVLLPAPAGLSNVHAHLNGVLRAAASLHPEVILAEGPVLEVLRERSLPAALHALGSLGPCAAPGPTFCGSFEYIQFTSGTSGLSKAVRVTSTALLENVRAIGHWLGWGSHHATVSWLPLHHDMGLVGCLFTSLVFQTDLYLLQPEQFIRAPVTYLERFGSGVAHFSAMPPFGLDHIVNRVHPEVLRKWDFSGWRALIVGAGRIRPQTLQGFQRLLAPHGLTEGVLCPAYGLAEATLAVTGHPPGEPFRCREEPENGALVGSGGREPSGSAVSCGRPLGGVEVCVHDGDGHALPEGQLGEVVVETPSTARYFTEGEREAVSFTGARTVRTGDAGWLWKGELYVVGRWGDGLKVRGTWLFPEDLEHRLSVRLPEAQGHVVILLGPHAGVDTLVCLLSQRARIDPHAVYDVLEGLAVVERVIVTVVPPGSLLRTSSGKPMRSSLWRSFLCGSFEAQIASRAVEKRHLAPSFEQGIV